MPRPLITLFTPTMNRPDFVIRLLKYYRDIGFGGRICIGDSSGDDQARQIEAAVGEVNGQLNVDYRRYPGANGVECVQLLLDSITTPYAAFASDDDFFVPSALDSCMEFLDANPEYSAAHGFAALMSVESNSAYGSVTGTEFYMQPEIEDDSPSLRLMNLLGEYSVTLFSVHRTETWRMMYREAHELTDWRGFGGELLQCSRTVIGGKVKELDCLSLVRQVYDHRNGSKSGNNESEIPNQQINMSGNGTLGQTDWLTGEDWEPSYNVYKDKIAHDLSEREGLTLGEAMDRVTESFKLYLVQVARKATNGKKPGAMGLARNLVESFGLVHKSLRVLKSAFSTGADQMSLEKLLRQSSPYHQEFMPIYWMVTTGSAATP